MFGGLISWDWNGGGLFFNNYWVLPDLASDNCYENGTVLCYLDLSKFTFDANNEVFEWIWTSCYSVINTSNVLLKEIENFNDYSNESVKSHLAGEAYFLRGILYFELVNIFGEVPLQLNATTDIESTKIKRSPINTVYESIISDLKNAEELLVKNPFSNRDEGMPTSLTASALLGKVYLQRGALNNDDSDFEKAKIYLEKVIGNYSLEPQFADIFKIKNANQGEIIWAVNFSGTLGEGWNTSQMLAQKTDRAGKDPRMHYTIPLPTMMLEKQPPLLLNLKVKSLKDLTSANTGIRKQKEDVLTENPMLILFI